MSKAELVKVTAVEKFADCLLLRWMTAEQVVKEADGDMSGDIDLVEFSDLCLNTLRLPFTAAEVTEVFRAVDVDNSGRCSVDEMTDCIENTSKKLEETRIEGFMKGVVEADERQDTKLVALVAHNNMKPSMMNFVAKHRDFFKTVQITTTGSTGAALEKKLGLKIARKVASGPLGGDQEIGAMITTDDCGAAFFFIDPLSAHPHDADIKALTRICEVHNCPCATNPSSGDALTHAFITSRPHIDALYKKVERGESDVVKKYKDDQKAVISSVAK